MRANDTQVGGDHYKSLGIYQPWDVLKAWLTPEEYRGWMKGNAIVYLAREQQKGGDTDIAKARHHLEKLLEVLNDEGVQAVQGDETDHRVREEQPSYRWVDDTLSAMQSRVEKGEGTKANRERKSTNHQ